MRTSNRDCSGCRYWSEMIARAGAGTTNLRGDVEALCLAPVGPRSQQYTVATVVCDAFAKNTAGAVDDPPDYGQSVRAEYARQLVAKHPNGEPMYAPDGTMLDSTGERSIFDDVDD